MVRKFLIGASLALLAAGVGRPAAADLKLLEPYGGIYSARTLLGSPDDKRPKDALQSLPSKVADPTQRFVISPFFAHSDGSGGDLTSYGGTLAYANSSNRLHPWQIQGSILNNHVDVSGVGSGDILQFDLTGKFVLFQPEDQDLPVISIVGRYADFESLGERYDILLAADQELGRRMFATANLGWSKFNCDCAKSSDLVAGLGLTYVFSRRLSLSADYTFSNNSDNTDLWTVAASYQLGRDSLLRVGGGKNSTLGQNDQLVFASYVMKFDFK
ncbi:MAG TPA: hypothetical protein VK689_17870 [Armatimonadota bacterium]|nr:hypothetical protein [Armatimonadota bacterium]